jgi:hypothetical protein
MAQATRDATARAATTREMTARPTIETDPDRNPFDLPPGVVPPEGYRYQWCREKIVGQDDDSNVSQLQMEGWSPVPVDRHPEMRPTAAWSHIKASKLVRYKGMILCERPEHLCKRQEAANHRRAVETTRAKEVELGTSLNPNFPRSGWAGRQPEITTTVVSPTGGVISEQTRTVPSDGPPAVFSED